jgi:hypothetical protein
MPIEIKDLETGEVFIFDCNMKRIKNDIAWSDRERARKLVYVKSKYIPHGVRGRPKKNIVPVSE